MAVGSSFSVDVIGTSVWVAADASNLGATRPKYVDLTNREAP